MADEVILYPTVIHRFLAELEAITPEQMVAYAPTDPVASNGKIIAELSDFHKVMLTLIRIKEGELSVLDTQHEAMWEAVTTDNPINQNIQADSLRSIDKLSFDSRILKDLFERSILEQFALNMRATGISICTGWQLVKVCDTG